VSTHTDFRGFESPPTGLDPDLTDLGNTTLITDGTAWQGLRYLRVYVSSAAAGGGVEAPATDLPTPTSGQPFDYRMEVFYRVEIFPSSAGCMIAGTLLNCQVEMDTAGHLRMRGPAGSANVSAYSAIPLQTNIWYRLELRHYGVWLTTGQSNSGRSRSTVDVYNALSAQYLFSVASAAQSGQGCAFSGDQSGSNCSAISGGIYPFTRANFTDSSASFSTMVPLGLSGVTIQLISGSQQIYYQPPVNTLVPILNNTTAANVGVCCRGSSGNGYTYIEQGLLAPFGDPFSWFYVDNGLSAGVFTLGQTSTGISCTRDMHYDAVTIYGSTGPDVPTPPAPPVPTPASTLTLGITALQAPRFPGTVLHATINPWQLQQFDVKPSHEDTA
jgi:hypothetical protein